MSKIAFHFFYILVRLVTYLPIQWLYRISDFIYLIIFYIIPYRKKLVIKNLKNAFPGKSINQINNIAKAFYKHFCDSLIEIMIGGFISEKEIKKRWVVKNPELCDMLFRKNKSISLLLAHYGNWEWGSVMPLHINHKMLPIYKPLRNRYIDEYVKKNRERFGAETVPMEKILRILMEYQKKKIPTLTYILYDQRPRWAQIQHWIKFLNQDTPVILGAEKISRKFDHSVVFLDITKPKRGFYEVEFKLLFENSAATDKFEITEKYYKILEKKITKEPHLWLWTHKRWKHKIEKYVPKSISY